VRGEAAFRAVFLSGVHVDNCQFIPGKVKKLTGARPAAPRWTEHDERVLCEMLEARKTAVEISHRLKRTPGAIYSRMQRVYRRQRPPVNPAQSNT
jgi:hypothetical protein